MRTESNREVQSTPQDICWGWHYHWGVPLPWGFDKGVSNGWCVSSGSLMNARTQCSPIEHCIVSRSLLLKSPFSGFNGVADWCVL